MRIQFSLSQPNFPAITAFGRRFANWWWKGFIDLVPERIVWLMSGDRRKRLTLRAHGQELSLTLLQRGAASVSVMQPLSATSTLAVIDRFLLAQGGQRRNVDLGLELPAHAFFSRKILLPAEAERSIDAIVAQDLARRTPFRAEDIYSDHVVIEGAHGKVLDVRQWIVSRHLVQDALLPLGLTVEQFDFVTIEAQGEPVQARIRLRRDGEARRSLHQKLTIAMSCSAILLTLALGGLRYWNQQVALDRLDNEIAATSRRAHQVRTLIDQLEQRRKTLVGLRLQRSEAPGLIDLWDETSRILPAHSWLTEFRLADSAGKGKAQVTLTGFSSAAPGLVGTIDGSRLLFDAALTSPVALDPAEGRERFTLQAKVRVPNVLKDGQR